MEATPGDAYIGLALPPEPAAFAQTQVCRDVAHYAHELFDFFRRCDAAGVGTIYGQRVEPVGLGVALMDRLQRAAE